jgi:hypothetical protein
MIVYDLACMPDDHRFEGWFGSSADFDDQQARGLLACPVCGIAAVAKAVMAPNLGRKGNQMPQAVRSAPVPVPVPVPPSAPVGTPAPAPLPAPVQANVPLPPEAIAVLHQIAKLQAEALKSSTWVGKDFAEDARAMHYGEKDAAPIHGQASPEEAEALIEEGITIAPILFPIAPPGKAN